MSFKEIDRKISCIQESIDKAADLISELSPKQSCVLKSQVFYLGYVRTDIEIASKTREASSSISDDKCSSEIVQLAKQAMEMYEDGSVYAPYQFCNELIKQLSDGA